MIIIRDDFEASAYTLALLDSVRKVPEFTSEVLVGLVDAVLCLASATFVHASVTVSEVRELVSAD